MIKAIETRYKGYRFRSRLEARWAVFFDALGVRWEYEPQGYDLGDLGWYLPDFFIHGNAHRGPYIEIKGTAPTTAEIEKLERVCLDRGAYGMILFGGLDAAQWVSIHKEVGRDGAEHDNPAIGRNGAYPFCKFSDKETAVALVSARAARFERGEADT